MSTKSGGRGAVSAAQTIRFIENYWGSELTARLAKRISAASFEELETFFSNWPSLAVRHESVQGLRPIIHRPSPRELQRARTSEDHYELLTIIRSLLYTPQVFVDYSIIFSFSEWDATRFADTDTRSPYEPAKRELALVEARLDERKMRELRRASIIAENNMIVLWKEGMLPLGQKFGDTDVKLAQELIRLAPQDLVLELRGLETRRMQLLKTLRPYSGDTDRRSRDLLARRLTRLAVLRPFIEDGSIKFGHVYQRLSDGNMAAYELALLLRDDAKELVDAGLNEEVPHGLFDDSFDSKVALYALQLGHTLKLGTENVGTAFFRSKLDAVIWRRVIQSTALDGRLTRLQTLGQLDLPFLQDIPEVLARLRADSAGLASWRQGLKGALDVVQKIPDNDTERIVASKIVQAELRDAIAPFSREVRESSVLSAIKEGELTFGLGALTGGAIGLATGNGPIQAVAGGVAGLAGSAVVEGIRRYVASRGAEKSGRLVWDLYSSLYPAGH